MYFLLSAVAIANDLACKGLDKIEKTLPILHQPSEQVCTRSGTYSWRNHILSKVTAVNAQANLHNVLADSQCGSYFAKIVV